MIWKLFGSKQSWTNFKLLSWHSIGGTEESHEILIMIAGLRVEI
jgi:hypothetical protein